MCPLFAVKAIRITFIWQDTPPLLLALNSMVKKIINLNIKSLFGEKF